MNDLWAELKECITNAANRHCPINMYCNKKGRMPWVNDELLEMTYERDFLYKKAKRSDSSEDWTKACRRRNHCNKMVKKAKDKYVQQQLVAHEMLYKKSGVLTLPTQPKFTLQTN